MSQSDYTIADQDGASFLVDINAQLAAIVSNNSGATEPTTTYAFMFWADTSSGLLKIRNAADNAWVTVGTLADANLGLLALAGGTLTGALNEAQGTDIASAATVNLTTATGNYVRITGTATITAITLAQGAERTVLFEGALTLTNGASLILPFSSSINTSAGDMATFRGEASGVVRCVNYEKRSRAIGYRTGQGASVVQLVSKSTAVAINFPIGRVVMNNAALAAGASVIFVVNNNLVEENDIIAISRAANDNSDAYRVDAPRVIGGLFVIRVTNISAGSLSDALNINFALIKGAVA